MNIEKMLINNARKAMLDNINALDKKTLQRELESHLKLEFKYKDEVDRLNNIINELEKEINRLLERQYESERFAKEQGFNTYLPAKENLLCVKNNLKVWNIRLENNK